VAACPRASANQPFAKPIPAISIAVATIHAKCLIGFSLSLLRIDARAKKWFHFTRYRKGPPLLLPVRIGYGLTTWRQEDKDPPGMPKGSSDAIQNSSAGLSG
jgi:hypothetical protein